MKKHLLRPMLALALLLLGGVNVMALENYDFQELCMKLGKGGPWAVNDGDDAGFTIEDATMHYLGDYTDQGFEWNNRFAYEYVDGRGKFTMRNKNNKKDANCGMFSWDYAHYFSVLDLKAGDKVTITCLAGSTILVSDNVVDMAAGDEFGKETTTYTISSGDRLDIQMQKATLISKIQIEPFGVETVPVISVSPNTLKLIPTATAKLKASVSPTMATTWASSDESVVTVAADGTVTAVAPGTATVTNSWQSEVSDATAEDACVITVADIDLSQYAVVRFYDFTQMGDISLELQEEALGKIWNDANSQTNDVFYCTNEGLEDIAVQAAAASNGKGWSVVDGKGLFLGTGAGRCAAIGGLKAKQIIEFIYTGETFATRSNADGDLKNGADIGAAKTALNEGVGRAIYELQEDGVVGFELAKGNAIEQINIYELQDVDDGSYKFVASEWPAGDAGRISPDNVAVDESANTITVSQTGTNNVALIFRSANTYTVKAEQRYFVVKGTGLSTADGDSYLWWLNNTNNGSQIMPTAIYQDGQGQTVLAWDCATIAIGGQLGMADTDFKDEGGWSTTFGLTLADQSVPAVISYIGFDTTIPNPVEEFEYTFVASEWPAGDPGRISPSNVVVDESANTITVNATGDNNVALNFKTDKIYYLPQPVKYFVIQATGLSTAEGKSYLWWLNAKNNGGQVAPTDIKAGEVTTFIWDITADATFASGFSAEGKSYLDGTGASTWGWTTTFGLTLADPNVPAVISYIGYETEDSGVITAINNLRSNAVNGAVYNLAGQRVETARKGLFIVNGKKVIK